ncbi:MAG: hypothetical protein IPG45_36400 [Deltaproteobacteria bacterium]|nr:hypothetical protein [Deltaproteobacteria bacterium]
MRVVTLLLASSCAAFWGCGQEITVLQCDGHVDVDAGVTGDTGPFDSGTPDLGMADLGVDGGTPGDTGPEPDSGVMGCNGATYCLTDLVVSAEEAPVRTAVTFTPTVDNPQSKVLTYRVELAGSSRRPELPALVLSDITHTINVDPNTGLVTFLVTEVPTWFASTTFEIRLYAKGPGNEPEVNVSASVKIKGNLVISSGSIIYAMASDGRPARSQNFTQGRFISGQSFVRTPRDLLLARDGSLVVYDFGAVPHRLRRFDLSGENSLLQDFEFQDANQMPYLERSDASRGLAQLPDGRYGAVDYSFSRTPKSRIVLFNENGSYAATLTALDPNVEWAGLTTTPAGELVTLERGTDGRLVTLSPSTGAVTGMIAQGVSNGFTVTRSDDGFYYVGLTSGVIRISAQGARQMVSGIQTGTSDWYQYFSPFGPTSMAISRDFGSESDNVGIVVGTMFTGWLRQAAVNNPYLTPSGLAYLD